MAQTMGGMIRWHSGGFTQGEGKDYKNFSSQNLFRFKVDTLAKVWTRCDSGFNCL